MSPVNATPNVPQWNFIPELYTGTLYRTGAIGSSKAGGEGRASRRRGKSVTGAFHHRIIIIQMPEEAQDPQDIGIID
jgi:hypothetical protein